MRRLVNANASCLAAKIDITKCSTTPYKIVMHVKDVNCGSWVNIILLMAPAGIATPGHEFSALITAGKQCIHCKLK